MAKYVTFFTYTSEAWARMIQNPGDRTATVRNSPSRRAVG